MAVSSFTTLGSTLAATRTIDSLGSLVPPRSVAGAPTWKSSGPSVNAVTPPTMAETIAIPSAPVISRLTRRACGNAAFGIN